MPIALKLFGLSHFIGGRGRLALDEVLLELAGCTEVRYGVVATHIGQSFLLLRDAPEQ